MSLIPSQIQTAYVVFFGRAADPDGLNWWVNNFRGSVDHLYNTFAGTAEYADQFRGLTPAQQVTRVYQNLLGRDPEPGGFAFWSAEVAAGRVTTANLALIISQNTQGTDTTTVNNRVAAAAEFTQALDTSTERFAYTDPAAHRANREWIATINHATPIEQRSGVALEAAVSNTVAAGMAALGAVPGGNRVLMGDAAANELRGGAGNDSINGAGGNDLIFGGNGADTLLGGDGDDHFVLAHGEMAPQEFIDGGAGTDTLSFAANSRNAAAGVSLFQVERFELGHNAILSASADLFHLQRYALTGGNAASNLVLDATLTRDVDLRNLNTTGFNGFTSVQLGNVAGSTWGTAARDSIVGGSGRDDIFAGGGDDTIEGGGASGTGGSGTFLRGQEGNDLIIGGIDADRISGGTGNDALFGREGNDNIDGDDGDDLIEGGAGLDDIEAGRGNDTVTGGSGGDVIWLDIWGSTAGANEVRYSLDGTTDIAAGVLMGNADHVNRFSAAAGTGMDLINIVGGALQSAGSAPTREVAGLGDEIQIPNFLSVATVADLSRDLNHASYNGRYVVEVQSVLPVGTALMNFNTQAHIDAAAAALSAQVNQGGVAGANFLIVMYDVDHDAALFRFQDAGTPGIQANELSLVGFFIDVGVGLFNDAHFA